MHFAFREYEVGDILVQFELLVCLLVCSNEWIIPIWLF